jgi:hypothetical protein
MRIYTSSLLHFCFEGINDVSVAASILRLGVSVPERFDAIEERAICVLGSCLHMQFADTVISIDNAFIRAAYHKYYRWQYWSSLRIQPLERGKDSV